MSIRQPSKEWWAHKLALCLCFCAVVNLSCGDNEVKPSWHKGIDDAIAGVMETYQIPGLSLALVRNEKLVYVASYGYADLEAGQVVAENSLFRIASISKVITAVTVLKLVDDGLISLDDIVFGDTGILGNEYGTPPDASKIGQITVRHLLNHKSGWTNVPTDPVVKYSESTQEELIFDMVTNRSLTYDPGTTFYYLNFGYLVLGRIIEKVTTTKYEAYVKAQILSPLGITDMRIGGNRLADRYPNEVRYYSNGTIVNDGAYLNDLERTDAAAGWIATPTDLSRLIVHIDKNGIKQDIVPAALISEVWPITFDTWYHTGSISGASAILAKLDDTYSLAVTFNVFATGGALEARAAVQRAITAVKDWPEEDLF